MLNGGGADSSGDFDLDDDGSCKDASNNLSDMMSLIKEVAEDALAQEGRMWPQCQTKKKSGSYRRA